MTPTTKRGQTFYGEITVRLANGTTWEGAWDFSDRKGCSKPSRVLRAARRLMHTERIPGRARWRGYTLRIDLE